GDGGGKARPPVRGAVHPDAYTETRVGHVDVPREGIDRHGVLIVGPEPTEDSGLRPVDARLRHGPSGNSQVAKPSPETSEVNRSVRPGGQPRVTPPVGARRAGQRAAIGPRLPPVQGESPAGDLVALFRAMKPAEIVVAYHDGVAADRDGGLALND